jgi:hypothetical protein
MSSMTADCRSPANFNRLPSVAIEGFAVDQQAEPFLEAEGSHVGQPPLVFQRLRHAGKAKINQPLFCGMGEHAWSLFLHAPVVHTCGPLQWK